MLEINLRFVGPDGSEEHDAYAITIRRFPCVVGRLSECDERLDLPFVSRRHCMFTWRDASAWVEDLGSRNGTFLNGERLQEPQPLHEGDRLDVSYLPFRVHLRAPQAAAASESRVPGVRGQPQHVLVVEDNNDAAERLALLLKKWGHEVEVAHDGPAALQAVQTHPPDTVFIDVRLPGMSGYQVAQQLRTQPGLERTNLVALTEPDAAKARRHSQDAGFDHLLTEPVSPDALQEALCHSR